MDGTLSEIANFGRRGVEALQSKPVLASYANNANLVVRQRASDPNDPVSWDINQFRFGRSDRSIPGRPELFPSRPGDRPHKNDRVGRALIGLH